MTEAQLKLRLILKQVFKFDKLALVVGFVVDVITLTSILLAIDLQNRDFEMPAFVSPGLAFTIWLLAIYTYLAYLHLHWERKQSIDASEGFGKYLFEQLIARFSEPFLLLPLFILLVLLFWIAAFADKSYTLVVLLALIVGVTSLFGLFGLMFAAADRSHRYEPRPVNEDTKNYVDENWEMIEEIVTLKLSRRQWLHGAELEDFKLLFDLTDNAAHYILAKYALKHLDTTEYAEVAYSETETRVTYEPVLINLENFDYDRYYYSYSS